EFANLQLRLTADSALSALEAGGAAQIIEVTVVVTATPVSVVSTEDDAPASSTESALATSTESALESELESTPSSAEEMESGAALPTVEYAQVSVIEIAGVGDLAAEAVTLRNEGETINLSGWTLTDGEGNLYMFPDYEFFARGQV